MVIIGWMREKVKKKATQSHQWATYISLGWYSPRNILSPLIPHFHQLPSPVTHKASMSFLPTPTDTSRFKHSSSPAKTVNLVCLYFNYSKELRYFSYENIFLLKRNLSAYIHVDLLFRVLILYFVSPPVTIVKYLNLLSCSCQVSGHIAMMIFLLSVRFPLKWGWIHLEWEGDLPILNRRSLVLSLFWAQKYECNLGELLHDQFILS